MTPILELANVSKRFGGIQAVKDASFSVGQGEILGLIGPNGAGKTTAFNMIAGFFKPDTGTIRLEGKDIAGKKPWEICEAGIGRTFQLSKPFGDLTVVENLMVGGFARNRDRRVNREKAEEMSAFLGMAAKRNIEANNLTAFDRRKLELGRALCTEPKLLLMDEVVAGATPSEAGEMVELVLKVRARGISILIVEHVMKVIMSLSDRVVVLDYGEMIASGPPKEVVSQPAVLKAYFGERYVQSRA
ncbi:ABC transporter ATP-binding protein [Metarhizobium album]|uniref:ABC transporter ATP-binding protein n=1 Tax=Metarhizobium album TaxID=2182425 RepID=A0A2U2DLY2_9HYPH|nr:ABC transporter ATP-binding protein [Rhizobium album]PWE54313.1 ABC transporter ATP-binding protein [Rhizobium album]